VGLVRTVLAVSLVGCLINAGVVNTAQAQESPEARSRPSPIAEQAALNRRENRDSQQVQPQPLPQLPRGDASDGPGAPASISKSRILLGFYCVMIIGASLLGGWLPQRFELSHTRMQMIISLIAGLMLAIGIFHMLPHAVAELGDDGPDKAAGGMMAGLVGMFLILRMFGFHSHSTEPFLQSDSTAILHGQSGPRSPAPAHDAAHLHSAPGAHSLSWVGVCLGMGLHSLMDGLALGASVESDAMRGVAGLFGLGTFLVVFLHKPVDSVSITSLMAIAGWSSRSQSLANLAFALICPLGAGLFLLGLHEFSGYQSTIVGYALAASAGVFLCIALSDLLPEMEFHSHNRVRLTAALIAGIVLGWAIHLLDPAHEHSREHSAAAKQRLTEVLGTG
jgi:zinc and cadmium transporter